MESRISTAARVHEIAPFHVMEVQTAARALEAAGRDVVHMEIGEPDFTTPAPVIAAAQRAIADGDIDTSSACLKASRLGCRSAQRRTTNSVSQRAALACFLPETLAILEERRIAFQARRDFLVPALRQLGFVIPVTPTGGFFVYADSTRFAGDSQHFCREVLEGAGVAITPGIDFGRHRAEAHVRFAYTIERHKLEQGVARLARFFAGEERDEVY